MTVRRHLVILLVLTLLIRGVMFISYPMGGQDEFQGFHRYLVAKVLSGDLMIGNLRYSPGYPLFIAPFAALGELFGRFDERVVLLVQIALSSSIPFFLYDIIKTRHSPKAAFLIGLLSLVDPFGLQWAHFSLPVWMVALCLVFSLWLLHHAERRCNWRLVLVAGLVTGLGVLGRWNYALVAVGLGCLSLFVRHGVFRQRLREFVLFSLSTLLLVLLVFVTLQIPATGVRNINCISAANLMETIHRADLTIHEDNGPNSKRFLYLISLQPLPQHLTYSRDYPLWYADIFPLWQTPGTWASDAARENFLNQSEPETLLNKTSENVHTFIDWLFFYLGPCELESLLRGVFFETVIAEPLRWLLGIPINAWQLLQPPLTMGSYPHYTVVHADSITYEKDGGSLRFQRAYSLWKHYTGQWVWRPGIELFTLVWAPLNALRFLIFPALVWSLFTRRRVYNAIACLLLLYVIGISTFDAPPESRIYAIVYPLGPVLIGGFLLAVWEKSRRFIAP